MKKALRLFLAIIVVSSMIAGFGTPADSADKKVLRWGKEMEAIGNLDVNVTNENNIYELSDLMLDTLVMKNPQTMAIEPNLADLPKISEDGALYTFKLKEGVKFVNGDELTAEDVEFTFYRVFAPQYNGLNTWFADMITGAQALMDGNADNLEGFKVIDKYSFSIRIDYPFSAFVSVLASSPFGIVNKKECLAAGDKWGLSTVVGTGAYKLVKFEPNVNIVFETNKDYFKGAPGLDGIEMVHMSSETAALEFEAGNIDLYTLNTDQIETYKNDPKFSKLMKYQEFQTTVYMMFNQSKKPLDDVRVRNAVSLAINADVIVDQYFDGNVTAANTYIPKGMIGYTDSAKKLTYDPEKAKQLLAEAGYPDGVTITVSESNRSSYIEIVQIMKEQMKAANINLELELTEAAAWMDARRNGALMAYDNGYTADYPDPDQFFYSIFRSDASKNRSTGLESPEVDARIDQGRLITDPAEKQAHYEALDRFIVSENYNLRPLYYLASYTLVSDRVENVFQKNDRLMYLGNAKIK